MANITVENIANSIWKGALHFTQGRAGMQPKYFVIHVMDGTLLGTDAWFNDPQCQASAHSGIGANGEVHDYVHSADSAWHCGVQNTIGATFDRFEKTSDGRLISPNYYTLGLEHEGHPNIEISEAAYAASASKIKFWSLKFNIPIIRKNFIRHSEIYAGHNCPNLAVNLDKLCALAQSAEPIYPESKQISPIA